MPIKVLLADMPQMLLDMVGAVLRREDDIEVVGCSQGREDLLESTRRTGAEVVVMGSKAAVLPDFADELLKAFPRIVLLAVSGDGRTATRFELRPEPVPLGEASPKSLIQAIRQFVPAAEDADA